MATLERAIEIAKVAHAGQIDKAGKDQVTKQMLTHKYKKNNHFRLLKVVIYNWQCKINCVKLFLSEWF